MKQNEIQKNAEDYINENIQGVVIDANARHFLLDTYIAGAKSRDKEIDELYQKNKEYYGNMSYWQKRARRLEVRRIHQGEKNKELRDKLQMSWRNTQERKPEAVEQKEFGARKLSRQVLAVYDDGKCHVERYDHDCDCWRWANGYGQMHEPKMWRYIDIPEGGTK